MSLDLLRLVAHTVSLLPSFAFGALQRRIYAYFHQRAYRSLPPSQTKNVVVIGGSFAGLEATRRLTETLPSGYRVTLVEKNSHFNYVFAFPRFSVIKGYEKYAFIPYSGLGISAPEGILCHVQDTVETINEKHVVLESGKVLEYEYLVMATGTSSALPSKVASTESPAAQQELRCIQERIAAADKIAVVGGGAVGVELATDIKSFNPHKSVTLIHSRGQLLHSFGSKLHDFVMKSSEELGITVKLNERPVISRDSNMLKFSDGTEEGFDLIVLCTSQVPNSNIISTLSPMALAQGTYHVLVGPTLQIQDENLSNVFAFGDVASTGGPKMARAAFFQSETVVHNIVKLINGETRLSVYKPARVIEGSIKLTLGKKLVVFYAQEDNDRELLVPLNIGKDDLDVKRQWSFFGADVRTVNQE